MGADPWGIRWDGADSASWEPPVLWGEGHPLRDTSQVPWGCSVRQQQGRVPLHGDPAATLLYGKGPTWPHRPRQGGGCKFL